MTALALAAVVALGLSAGAMLTEAVLFVDLWRAMPPEAFLQWFGTNEPHLLAFYGSLEIATTLLVLATAIAFAFARRPGTAPWGVAAALSIVVLLLFFVYFSNANASFVARTITVDAVPAELTRWGAWQWVRTACGVGAFVAGLLGLRAPAPA